MRVRKCYFDDDDKCNQFDDPPLEGILGRCQWILEPTGASPAATETLIICLFFLLLSPVEEAKEPGLLVLDHLVPGPLCVQQETLIVNLGEPTPWIWQPLWFLATAFNMFRVLATPTEYRSSRQVSQTRRR